MPIFTSDIPVRRATVKDMTDRWQPERYADTFSESIKALLKKRREAGETAQVEPQEEAPDHAANVVDLTELLKASLAGRRGGKAPASASRRRA